MEAGRWYLQEPPRSSKRAVLVWPWGSVTLTCVYIYTNICYIYIYIVIFHMSRPSLFRSSTIKSWTYCHCTHCLPNLHICNSTTNVGKTSRITIFCLQSAQKKTCAALHGLGKRKHGAFPTMGPLKNSISPSGKSWCWGTLREMQVGLLQWTSPHTMKFGCLYVSSVSRGHNPRLQVTTQKPLDSTRLFWWSCQNLQHRFNT